MVQAEKVNSLAQQLQKNGIAFTELDAKRLAEQMLEGNEQVSKQHTDFMAQRKRPEATPTYTAQEHHSGQEHVIHKALHDELDNLRKQLQEQEEELKQVRQHNSTLQQEIEKINTSQLQTQPQSQPQKTQEQEDILQSQVPIGELLNENKQQEQMVEEMLEPVDQSADTTEQNVAQEVFEIHASPESQQQEQEDITFIGETEQTPQINTQADAPPKREAESTPSEYDLSNIFNVNK
jgi:DNA repair exonuclease SbcCD ATPase subunit